jgi:hypothetical protein
MTLQPPTLQPPFDDHLEPRSPGAASASGAPFRPECVAGVDSPASTSLKWGADGELTSLDLHNLLARLCVHDPQVCRGLEEDEAGAA